MYTYKISFGDGFFTEIVHHEKRFTAEEFEEIIESVPDMPTDYAKDGWLGGWVCEWYAEYLTKNFGFVNNGWMSVSLNEGFHASDYFVDNDERKAIE